jgi:polar amino acid transport system substrate-binding protein
MNTVKALGLFVFLLAFSCDLLAEDFIVLGTNDPPLKYFEGNKNNVKGINVDILKEAIGEMGFNPIFKIVDSDPRIQVELKSGKAQMAMLYSYRKHRERFFIYPTESIVRLSWHFFCRSSDCKHIPYQSFDDFKNLRVGAVNGISYTNEFLASGLKFQHLGKKGSELDMLVKNRIDVIALPTFITLRQIIEKNYQNKIGYLEKPLKSRLYYNVFGNNTVHYDMKELIATYDKIIKRMKASGRIREIFRKHVGDNIDLDVLLDD